MSVGAEMSGQGPGLWMGRDLCSLKHRVAFGLGCLAVNLPALLARDVPSPSSWTGRTVTGSRQQVAQHLGAL